MCRRIAPAQNRRAVHQRLLCSNGGMWYQHQQLSQCYRRAGSAAATHREQRFCSRRTLERATQHGRALGAKDKVGLQRGQKRAFSHINKAREQGTHSCRGTPKTINQQCAASTSRDIPLGCALRNGGTLTSHSDTYTLHALFATSSSLSCSKHPRTWASNGMAANGHGVLSRVSVARKKSHLRIAYHMSAAQLGEGH
jgi:hypothetical protein